MKTTAYSKMVDLEEEEKARLTGGSSRGVGGSGCNNNGTVAFGKKGGAYGVHGQQNMPSLGDYLSAWFALFSYHFPCLYRCFCCILFVLVIGILINFLFNPIEEYGNINPSLALSSIASKIDMTMKYNAIKHHCLGGRRKCPCEDPLTPTPGPLVSDDSYYAAHRKNVNAVTSVSLEDRHHQPVVAFIGAGIVEAMTGHWLSSKRSPELLQIGEQFNHFQEEQNMNCLALGIAGDTSPNVLWRLMNGELPQSFHPRVFWLVLGMNDLAKMSCNEEVVTLGILRVVQEIMDQKPKAQIVINGLFPMSEVRDIENYPWVTDFEHSIAKQFGGKSSVLPSYKERSSRKIRKNKRSSDTSDSKDDVVEDKTRMRKYKALTAFTRTKKVPLFTSIRGINRELAEFARKQDRVHFFDPTPFYTKRRSSDGKFILMKPWITPQGHLTAEGYKKWLAQVGKVIQELGHDNADLIEGTYEDWYAEDADSESGSIEDDEAGSEPDSQPLPKKKRKSRTKVDDEDVGPEDESNRSDNDEDAKDDEDNDEEEDSVDDEAEDNGENDSIDDEDNDNDEKDGGDEEDEDNDEKDSDEDNDLYEDGEDNDEDDGDDEEDGNDSGEEEVDEDDDDEE